jgi:DNA-binding PadR family transcriptional regulator
MTRSSVLTVHESRCNYLQACLLLLLSEQPGHGYELALRLAPLGLAGTDAACVYRALRTLERAALVESNWTSSCTGPDRRVYSVTALGRAEVEAFGQGLRRDQVQAQHYLDRLAALPPAGAGRPVRVGEAG